MDSLQEILGNKSFVPPDEIEIIKNYVRQKYQSECRVKLQNGTIILTAPNSSLAAMIQLERQKLIKACKITQKLAVRSG